jgi:hypothetical protein
MQQQHYTITKFEKLATHNSPLHAGYFSRNLPYLGRTFIMSIYVYIIITTTTTTLMFLLPYVNITEHVPISEVEWLKLNGYRDNDTRKI